MWNGTGKETVYTDMCDSREMEHVYPQISPTRTVSQLGHAVDHARCVAGGKAELLTYDERLCARAIERGTEENASKDTRVRKKRRKLRRMCEREIRVQCAATESGVRKTLQQEGKHETRDFYTHMKIES